MRYMGKFLVCSKARYRSFGTLPIFPLALDVTHENMMPGVAAANTGPEGNKLAMKATVLRKEMRMSEKGLDFSKPALQPIH